MPKHKSNDNEISLEDQKHREVEPFLEAEPDDRGNVVFYIILLHGIGTLMPWNMFINIAPSYYQGYKMQADNGTTWYSENFMKYLGPASQIPNWLLNLLNIFVQLSGGLSPRIKITMIMVIIMVSVTNAFTLVDTSAWLGAFFWLTLGIVALLNGANGVYQNSIYGLVSDFPFKYTNAVIIGNNLCGSLVAILSIVAVKITKDVKWQAFLYFTISIFTLIVCLISFFRLQSNRYFRFFSERGNENRAKENSGPIPFSEYVETIKQGYAQFINVFMVFFVTLVIFPNFMVDIRPNLKGQPYEFIVEEDQYRNFFVFLLFNFAAFLGSLTANKIQFPSPRYLWIPVFSRLAFIPFFLYCNFKPDERVQPVLFASYYVYILGAILMSFSSGYLSSLGMMYAPRVVDDAKARTAGMMASFSLISGIVSGLLAAATFFSLVL